MGKIDDYEEGDIIEPDEWRNPEEQVFNHQVLVMTAIKKCLDAGSKELKEGYWNEKMDKFGNVHRVWVEDTRKVFMESVRSLLMVVECDYDDKAKEEIPKLLKEIETRKKFWLNEQWRWWASLTPMQKQMLSKDGKHVIEGFFNTRLQFDNYFFEEETLIYRRICTEINNLTQRLDFYGTLGYSA